MRNRFIVLLGFTIAVVVTACSSSRIVGEYKWKGSTPLLSEVLILHSDSTFRLESWFDMGGEIITEGTWRFENGVISLKEKPVEMKSETKFSYSYQPGKKDVVIQVLDLKDSTQLLASEAFLNDSTAPMKKINGIEGGSFYEIVDSIKSVRLKYLSKEMLAPRPRYTSNRLTIFWDLEVLGMKAGFSKRWRHQRRKLIPLDEGYSGNYIKKK